MTILQRAHEEELLYKDPRDIVHFEETPEAAVKWIEAHFTDSKKLNQQKTIKKRPSILKRLESNLSGSTFSTWGRMTSFFGDKVEQNAGLESDDAKGPAIVWNNMVIFMAGLSLGLLVATRMGSKKA